AFRTERVRARTADGGMRSWKRPLARFADGRGKYTPPLVETRTPSRGACGPALRGYCRRGDRAPVPLQVVRRDDGARGARRIRARRIAHVRDRRLLLGHPRPRAA